jgi:uncharacterized alpha-E superfamily protein
LLVTDDTNPRSIVFQLQRIDQLIGDLPNAVAEVGLGHDEKIAKSLLHQVQMSDPFQLSRIDDQLVRSGLKELLESLIDGLPQLSNAITARYLIHTSGAQALTGRLNSSPALGGPDGDKIR